MIPLIRLKFENGVFIPLDPVPTVDEGDLIEFMLPDENIVYLCENDKLAALETGHVVWTQDPEGDTSADD